MSAMTGITIIVSVICVCLAAVMIAALKDGRF